MSKTRIGIPRALYYYYFGELYQKFFEKLDFEVVTSSVTNRKVVEVGIHYAVDEMCLPMKILFGHIDALKGKCDYIVLPRIDNYGIDNQTCTNFLALYDIVSNLFSIPLIHYNIDYDKGEGELEGFIKMGKMLGINELQSMKAYEEACEEIHLQKCKQILQTEKDLEKEGLKILLVSHPYNLHDEMIGKPIVSFLQKMGVTVILSDQFDTVITEKKAEILSKDLYWKYSKENLGSIVCARDKVDGIIFLSSFPCALDSLSYELAMRKVHMPYLHLVIDDLDASAGIETRMESFIDILEGRNYVR